MNKGFTLVELLVVTAIMAVLLALVVPNFRFGEKQFAFQNSAHQLAQDLRQAQEKAMSSAEFNGAVPQGGYGIYFNKNDSFYTLFADCSGNKQYDSGGIECGGVSEKISEESFLNSDVIINDLFSPLPKDELHVVFVPPDPIVYIEPDNGSVARIFIRDSSGGLSDKIITVNKAGLISIQDSG